MLEYSCKSFAFEGHGGSTYSNLAKLLSCSFCVERLWEMLSHVLCDVSFFVSNNLQSTDEYIDFQF